MPREDQVIDEFLTMVLVTVDPTVYSPSVVIFTVLKHIIGIAILVGTTPTLGLWPIK